jgi:hypothetical protein
MSDDLTPGGVFMLDGQPNPVGRPTVTVMIDAFSRAIIGIEVTFKEDTNWDLDDLSDSNEPDEN